MDFTKQFNILDSRVISVQDTGPDEKEYTIKVLGAKFIPKKAYEMKARLTALQKGGFIDTAKASVGRDVPMLAQRLTRVSGHTVETTTRPMTDEKLKEIEYNIILRRNN
jgi:hypothetical protein